MKLFNLPKVFILVEGFLIQESFHLASQYLKINILDEVIPTISNK